MDIARGPDPATLDVAQPERTPAASQTAEVPAAIAALPQDERRSFESMNADIDRQLASVSTGAAVPPALAGALSAQAQVYESLGLEAPQSHADVRARLTEPTPAETGPAGPTTGSTPENTPERGSVSVAIGEDGPAFETAQEAVTHIRGVLAQGRGSLSEDGRTDIEATLRGMDRDQLPGIVAGLSVSEIGEVTAAFSQLPTASKESMYGRLASALDSASLVKLAQGLQAGSERPQNPGSALDGQILGASIGQFSADRERFVTDAARLGPNNPAVGLAAGEAFTRIPSREARERVVDQLSEAGTLGSLIEGSVFVHTDRRNGWEVTVDTSTYANVMRATAFFKNDLANGQIVEAAAQQLARVEHIQDRGVRADLGNSISQIRGGITGKFFGGVMSPMNGYNQLYPNGGGPLDGYYESMGQTPETAKELTSIRQSIAVGGTPMPVEFQEEQFLHRY